MDITADGDVRMSGARWQNSVTPDLTSLLTKGRADALYGGPTTETLAITWSTDLNDALPSNLSGGVSVYRLSGAVPNGFPEANSGDFVTTYSWNTDAARQVGQNWNLANGAPMYYRDKIGGVWGPWEEAGGGGGTITSGDTFPDNPQADALHYRTKAPVGLYVYFDDGDSQQWVQSSGSEEWEFHDPTNVASWRISGNTLECWGQSQLGATVTQSHSLRRLRKFRRSTSMIKPAALVSPTQSRAQQRKCKSQFLSRQQVRR